MGAGPIRALTGGRRTKPTSTGCRRLRQPEPGRRSTYQAGEPVQTNRASSRDASILFDVAADPVGGNLYAVWQDRRFAGVEQVAFSMSTDGANWSSPVRIDKTPPNNNKLREQAFIPSVAVTTGGRVVVTYYDF